VLHLLSRNGIAVDLQHAIPPLADSARPARRNAPANPERHATAYEREYVSAAVRFTFQLKGAAGAAAPPDVDPVDVSWGQKAKNST
jgi:hypothetical protein